MLALYQHALLGQFEAGLAMVKICLQRCPDAHWDTPIAKYPFWQVAYHTLCFVDLYLSPGEDVWQPRTADPALHPAGWDELNEEYPSRRFERDELVAYTQLCRDLASNTLTQETAESLAGPSGFKRQPFPRAEMHVYNLRHLQHHAGQLSAALHKLGIDADWVKTGWRE